MQAIFNTLTQAANTVTKSLSAVEKFASAVDHIGTWADESAASFADEAKDKRAQGLEVRKMEFQALIAQRRAAVESQTARISNKK